MSPQAAAVSLVALALAACGGSGEQPASPVRVSVFGIDAPDLPGRRIRKPKEPR